MRQKQAKGIYVDLAFKSEELEVAAINFRCFCPCPALVGKVFHRFPVASSNFFSNQNR